MPVGDAFSTVATTDRDTVTVAALPSARVVAVLNEAGVPFSEVAGHRASLEEAYLELTRQAVEFRAGSGETP